MNVVLGKVSEEHAELLRTALESEAPFDAALELAKRLRDEGMPHDNLKMLFNAELDNHRDSRDETKWDAVADTLDYIVGWCSPGQDLYPEGRR